MLLWVCLDSPGLTCAGLGLRGLTWIDLDWPGLVWVCLDWPGFTWIDLGWFQLGSGRADCFYKFLAEKLNPLIWRVGNLDLERSAAWMLEGRQLGS